MNSRNPQALNHYIVAMRGTRSAGELATELGMSLVAIIGVLNRAKSRGRLLERADKPIEAVSRKVFGVDRKGQSATVSISLARVRFLEEGVAQ